MFLVVVALAAAAGLVVKLASPGGGGSAAASIDPHGAADVPASKVRRVLAATEAASTSSSQAELVSQGRAMFNDPALAKRGESCGGCHTIGTTNAALGTTPHFDADGKVIFARDPPTLVDAAKTPPYGWIGGAATLREMVLNTIFTHFKDGVSQPEDKTAEEAAALVAYISSIRAPTSSFDQGTMSAAALRGEALFQGKGACIACHGGPAFTDNGLHNTLVEPAGVERPRRYVPARRVQHAHAARRSQQRAVHAQWRVQHAAGGGRLLQLALVHRAAAPHAG